MRMRKGKKGSWVRWDFLLKLMVAEAERREHWGLAAMLYCASLELKRISNFEKGLKLFTRKP